ncbi:MAG: hypothetical protein O7B99_11240, partial [Planctomycetota bacterium]|nr:hypothetical protein [Planctomycetota bacterium]
FLRTPALLKNAVLRLEDAATGLTFSDFDIISATYDDAGIVLRITADPAGPSPATFISSQAPDDVVYRVIKRFFRVSTGGVADSLPDTAFVRILFMAAAADADGQPDEANPVVDWTPDISDFNLVAPGLLDFFRYEVEFNLAASGALTSETEAISLEFLRFPFSF